MIRQVTLISDVLIIRILIFSSASAWNAREATPEWLRMPTPIIDILDTFEVAC